MDSSLFERARFESGAPKAFSMRRNQSNALEEISSGLKADLAPKAYPVLLRRVASRAMSSAVTRSSSQARWKRTRAAVASRWQPTPGSGSWADEDNGKLIDPDG
jgi:hypothetical protein